MTGHRSPLYCPFCGDQDLFPVEHGAVEQGPVEHEAVEHGPVEHDTAAWECRSCTRVFAVRTVSPASPASTEVTS